jgi:5-methylcytosine-specific restriction protein A
MPSRAPKPCSTPGCRNLLKVGRFCRQCMENGKARESRPNAGDRGYNARWRDYRIEFLSRNRFCADPFEIHEIPVFADVVDHRKPHKGNMELFWDESNHQALCEFCHNRKTAKFDGGFAHITVPFPNE